MSVLEKFITYNESESQVWNEISSLDRKAIKDKIYHSGFLTFKGASNLLETRLINLSKSDLFYLSENFTIFSTKIKWNLIDPFYKYEDGVEKCGFSLISKSRLINFEVESSSCLKIWIEKLSKVGISTNFEENYVVIKPISHHKYYSVYLCENILGTSRQYFLKKYHNAKIESDTVLKKVYNEILILRKINYPTIAKLNSVYEDSSSIYLLFDYTPFGNLNSLISKKEKIPIKEIIKFCVELIKTLRYLQSNCIICKNLSLKSIILMEENSIKNFRIVDLSFACKNNEKNDFKIENTRFIAPELLSSTNYSHKVDVFCVGAILYCLITKEYPFKGKTQEETLKNNTNCNISFKNKTLKNSPIALFGILKELLEPHPCLRPSADQIINSDFYESLKFIESFLDSATTVKN